MRIVAAMSANLSAAEVASYGITLLPARLMVDGVEHHVREGFGIHDVDRWVREAREVPHNVGSTASEIVEILLEVSAKEREMLLILPSHKIIGTHQAAVSAERVLMKRRASAGLRVLIAELGATDCSGALAAIYAGEARKAGLAFDAVVAATRAFTAAARAILVPRVLDRLVMGGHAGFLRAKLSELESCSPVLTFTDGALTWSGETCPREDPIPAIVASCEAQMGSGRRIWLAVTHGGSEAGATRLAAEMKRRFRVEHLLVRTVSPTLHLHLGPQALAAFATPVDELPWSPGTRVDSSPR